MKKIIERQASERLCLKNIGSILIHNPYSTTYFALGTLDNFNSYITFERRFPCREMKIIMLVSISQGCCEH